MTRSPRLLVAGLAAAVALVGAGLGIGLAVGGGHDAEPVPSASANDHSAHTGGGLDAAAFIDRMVPHHQMAIEMSEDLIARSKDAEMRAVAQEIIALQSHEIAQMRKWRKTWTGEDVAELSLPHEELAAMGMTHRVDLATSPAIDADFLDAMIPHHAGGIVMAERALQAEDQRPELAALARRIITNQGREIGVMQGMRQNIATFGRAVPKATGGRTTGQPVTP